MNKFLFFGALIITLGLSGCTGLGVILAKDAEECSKQVGTLTIGDNCYYVQKSAWSQVIGTKDETKVIGVGETKTSP